MLRLAHELLRAVRARLEADAEELRARASFWAALERELPALVRVTQQKPAAVVQVQADVELVDDAPDILAGCCDERLGAALTVGQGGTPLRVPCEHHHVEAGQPCPEA